MRSQSSVDSGAAPWRDSRLSPTERAEALLPLMSLEEKVAQLVGVWVGAEASGEGVAPHQSDMIDNALPWSGIIQHGLGQLTRPFGTAPVDPVLGARSLAASQAQIVAASRFGIPAQVHEECLTGFAAWRATVYPTPLSWGASFDPDLVEAMADRIGRSMRAAGVHQGSPRSSTSPATTAGAAPRRRSARIPTWWGRPVPRTCGAWRGPAWWPH